jgi:hypothetical protein
MSQIDYDNDNADELKGHLITYLSPYFETRKFDTQIPNIKFPFLKEKYDK